MSSPLSEIDFLRSELDKMFKRTLELEFENKSLKKELADNRVFAYTQQKEKLETVSVGGAGAGSTAVAFEDLFEVFSSSSSSVPETPWFSSSSSSAPLDFTTPPGTVKAVASPPPLPKSPPPSPKATVAATVAATAVAATAVVDPKEAHRIANERKRLQALWIQHKVRPEKPISKLLKTLREGLKEAGVAF